MNAIELSPESSVGVSTTVKLSPDCPAARASVIRYMLRPIYDCRNTMKRRTVPASVTRRNEPRSTVILQPFRIPKSLRYSKGPLIREKNNGSTHLRIRLGTREHLCRYSDGRARTAGFGNDTAVGPKSLTLKDKQAGRPQTIYIVHEHMYISISFYGRTDNDKTGATRRNLRALGYRVYVFRTLYERIITNGLLYMRRVWPLKIKRLCMRDRFDGPGRTRSVIVKGNALFRPATVVVVEASFNRRLAS